MSAISNYKTQFIIMIFSAVALSGILLGFDTAVMSTIIASVSTQFQLDSLSLSWAMLNIGIGVIAGVFGASWLAARMGRKNAMLLASVLFLVSSLGSSHADTFSWFVFFRIASAMSVGIVAVVLPLYISEVIPRDEQGKLNWFQSGTLITTLIGLFILGFFLAHQIPTTTQTWHGLLQLELYPCFLFASVILFMPDSPRWLAMVQRQNDAFLTLEKMVDVHYAQVMLVDIEASLKERDLISKEPVSMLTLMKQSYFWAFTLFGLGLALLQQFIGPLDWTAVFSTSMSQWFGYTDTLIFMAAWIAVFPVSGYLSSRQY
ncbi:MFS transporter [Vibrio zhugei]|uniref:MFS transporter n=1 Tax=Vibrio zhugei TaxID=2479546 RepID=A0ABV7CCY3_9VIBR|nr:MFS transporter [Vibrio zhugei]